MIPTTGWLAAVDNTGQPPIDFRLPEEHIFSYADGAQGVISTPTEDGIIPIIRFVGAASVEGEAGLVANSYGFAIRVGLHSVFSIALLDSIDPPALPESSFEPEVAVVEPFTETPIEYMELVDYEACCEVEDAFFWLYDYSVTLDGSRKWGTIA